MRIFESATRAVLIDGQATGAVIQVVVDGQPHDAEISPEECADAGAALIKHASRLFTEHTAEGGT